MPWYGGLDKTLEIVTGVSLWYHRGTDPVRLRWVLVRCPDHTLKPTAFFCSDPTVSADQILRWFVCRWNIEVTFEELRAHLGFETQRQWSERAIERTAPCLFGLFSLIVVMAKTLHPQDVAASRNQLVSQRRGDLQRCASRRPRSSLGQFQFQCVANGRRPVPNSAPDARSASASGVLLNLKWTK